MKAILSGQLQISSSAHSSDESGRKLPQHLSAFSATLSALATGSMIGWSSPVVFEITQIESTEYDFPVSISEGDWISSIMNLGAAAICYPAGIIMDAIGRKQTMLCFAIPFALGWLLISFASSVAMLIAGRFITGVAGGAFCVAAPAYTSEIAQDAIRGALGSYFQLMITVGIFFSYSIGSIASVFVFNLLCTTIPLIFAIIFFFMPESPSYLVVKGRMDEARKALIRLRGEDYNVDRELNNLKRQAQEARNKPASFLTAITQKTAIKALVICHALMFFQQFSGINAVTFNTAAIFDEANTSYTPAAGTMIIGVIQVISTLLSLLAVDRFGRRILLLVSASVSCLCLAVLGTYFYIQEVSEDETVEEFTWLPLVCLSLYIIAFSLGIGPIPWMMPGELCLMEVKAFVGSTTGILKWLFSFTVTRSFNSLKILMGEGQVFWMYAFVILLGFVFIFIVVPETKGKTIEEVQEILSNSIVQR